MYAWSVKRRFIYGGIVVIFLSIIFSLFYFKFLYSTPTCTDGVKNGDELGIDCGGGCKNICTTDSLTPVVLWSKIFNISGDVYTAVAYVQNPNITSKNTRANYKFTIYGEDNKKILEKEGFTSIPKNKKFAVFEPNLLIKDKKPKFVDFEFTTSVPWTKDPTNEPDIFIEHSTLVSTSTSPRITGKVTNKSLENISQVELDVFVLDGKENVVAASRTYLEDLLKGSTQDFVFTWPKPFNLGVEVCLNPLDVVVDLDKSGSMRSEALVPPEPFTTVLATAKNFVKNLTVDDQVSVVSFGTNANTESILGINKDTSTKAIDNLTLSTTTEQTNITEGLQKSLEQLTSSARSDSKKVIVLLTDGIPTLPKQDGVDDYPSISAQKVAEEIKAKGIEIFTIGLGKNVSEGFLKSISTDDNHYFNAPSRDTLSGIYNKIGTGLCPKKPNIITVIYKVI